MSNVFTSTPSLSVADCDAGRQVTKDCVDAAVNARDIFDSTDYPLPPGLPGNPPPEAHQTIAMILEVLNAALDGEPLVAKVEPYFTELGGVELAGVGIEANGHRLAMRYAILARGAILKGILKTVREQSQNTSTWKAFGKTIQLSAEGQKVPQKLAEQRDAELEHYSSQSNACAKLLLGPSPTAERLKAFILPHTWRTIRDLIGDPMEIDLGALGARVETEYLCACRLALALNLGRKCAGGAKSPAENSDGTRTALLERAIAQLGKEADATSVIKKASVKQATGRRLLRILESQGKYSGFKRKSPANRRQD
jgi:hypothetical protein